METVLAKNAYKFDYFSIYEFIDKITLDPSILSHAFETEVALSEYMEDITSHNNKVIDLFLTNAFYKEIKESNLIEGNLIYPEEILNGDIYLDTFNMNHTRIKNLHHFIERGTGSDEALDPGRPRVDRFPGSQGTGAHRDQKSEGGIQ